MLILTRRISEKIIIGENVTVTILSVKGNHVRIGIDAPRDVKINREEIFKRVQKEQKELNREPQRKTASTLSLVKTNQA